MAPLSLDALRREAEAEMRRKAPREIDGADVAKKRRKTAADGDGGDDDANDDHDGSIELDVSLERRERRGRFLRLGPLHRARRRGARATDAALSAHYG